MRGKILFVTGLAAGYVLGTRAGRKRYEQLRSAARSVWNTAPVQQGVETVRDVARSYVGDAGDVVADALRRTVRSLAAAAASLATDDPQNAAPKRTGATTSAKTTGATKSRAASGRRPGAKAQAKTQPAKPKPQGPST